MLLTLGSQLSGKHLGYLFRSVGADSVWPRVWALPISILLLHYFVSAFISLNTSLSLCLYICVHILPISRLMNVGV